MDVKVLYGTLLGLTVLLFLRMKWRRDLRKEEYKKKSREHQRMLSIHQKTFENQKRYAFSKEGPFDLGPSPQISGQFMYNGHTWDACEVLGLSEDFTQEELQQAYEKSLNEVDEDSQGFIHLAYETLSKRV